MPSEKATVRGTLGTYRQIHALNTGHLTARIVVKVANKKRVFRMKKVIKHGVCLTLLLAMTTAKGQDSDEVTNQQSSESKVERITVTGSRIKRVDTEGASSITQFKREDLDKSSFTTVAEFIQNNIPSGAFTNENFTLSQTAGSASVGGRDQNSEYTLVLVNGRRMPTNAARHACACRSRRAGT